MATNCRLISGIVTVCFLAACVSPLPKIDSTPETLSGIRSIDVIRPPEITSYSVQMHGQPPQVMFFGAIGALIPIMISGAIATADENSKEKLLNPILKRENPQISNTLASSVAARLNEVGYQAQVMEAHWEDIDGQFTLDVSKIRSSADAVLVISPSLVGFRTLADIGYVPTLTIVATLLGKDRSQTIYKGFHASGYYSQSSGWRNVYVDHVPIPDFDYILNNPGTAVVILKKVTEAIAVNIASDIKR